MLDFVPDPEQFSKIFDPAIAPSFFLGAVAAFAALMTSRMNDVLDRTLAWQMGRSARGTPS